MYKWINHNRKTFDSYPACVCVHPLPNKTCASRQRVVGTVYGRVMCVLPAGGGGGGGGRDHYTQTQS